MYNLQFISAMVAEKLSNQIPGMPAEDKILVLSPSNVNQTKAGIIIPGDVKEGVPRKGVVIKKNISEEYEFLRNSLGIGHIVEYGLYAGKEHQFDSSVLEPALQELLKNQTLTVLAVNEISYIEPNNVD